MLSYMAKGTLAVTVEDLELGGLSWVFWGPDLIAWVLESRESFLTELRCDWGRMVG